MRDPGPFGITGLNLGERKDFEIPVEIAAPYQPGSTRRVTVTVETGSGRTQAEADITVAEPGWTMWMVSHFHYDPVWWNTQGQFTEARLSLPDEDGQMPDVRAAFELVSAHLDKARKDGDYKFVLAEIDYLKPYFDAFPQDRQDLRRAAGRGPGGDRRRQLQRAEHQPDQRRSHHPQRRVRDRVPAGRVRRRPAVGVDARRVRARPGVPGPDGGGRADLIGVGARAVPPVGAVRCRGRRRPADAVRHRVRVDLARRPRAAHGLHGPPLRRGLAAAHAAGPAGRRGRGVRAVPGAGAGRGHAGTSCCRSARTTSSRPGG